MGKMGTVKIKIINILFVIITLIDLSCKTSSTEPAIKPIDKNPPGGRNYIWTVDTILTPYSDFEKIWRSSADNIWPVGNGSRAKKPEYKFYTPAFNKKEKFTTSKEAAS